MISKSTLRLMALTAGAGLTIGLSAGPSSSQPQAAEQVDAKILTLAPASVTVDGETCVLKDVKWDELSADEKQKLTDAIRVAIAKKAEEKAAETKGEEKTGEVVKPAAPVSGHIMSGDACPACGMG